LAHRGASKDAPENTLRAFAEAVSQRADGAEFDVQVCGSGEVVVCHDARLDRLAGIDVAVRETPWWKLRRLDVGSPLGFASATIPRLEEVVEAMPDSFLLNIELKAEGFGDGGLPEKVVDIVDDMELWDRAVLSSFSPLLLLRARAQSPRLKTGLLFEPERSPFLQTAFVAPWTANYSIHPHSSVCTAARVKQWHDAKLLVMTWTVDDAAVARGLVAQGVDVCITNVPRQLREALEKR
jgi:glycerophosphoryl diester phosphodiesterase